MKAEPKTGLEPWAWVAFALGGLVAASYLYLGLRPGGRGPVLVFKLGLPLLGTAAGLWMAVGLVWSVLHRPVLQRGRLKALLCGAASVWAASLPVPYPSSHEGKPSAVAFRLPFHGERRVRWGGDAREQNAMLLDPARRFGIVFEPPAEGELQGELVLAPASGLLRGQREIEPGVELWATVLEVAEGQYLVLEGLARGAPEGTGDRIEAGSRLGVLAPPGTLTVYLTDLPEAGRGEGIPFAFQDYLSGGEPVERGSPVRGERVAPDPAVSGD